MYKIVKKIRAYQSQINSNYMNKEEPNNLYISGYLYY